MIEHKNLLLHLTFIFFTIFMNYICYHKGPFGAHDRETEYDKTIISCFNPLFGAPIGNDKLNLFLILSYPPFVILILDFCWVSNLIAQNYQARILFPQSTSFDSHVSSVFSFFTFFVFTLINRNGTETPTFLQFFLFSFLFALFLIN